MTEFRIISHLRNSMNDEETTKLRRSLPYNNQKFTVRTMKCYQLVEIGNITWITPLSSISN